MYDKNTQLAKWKENTRRIDIIDEIWELIKRDFLGLVNIPNWNKIVTMNYNQIHRSIQYITFTGYCKYDISMTDYHNKQTSVRKIKQTKGISKKIHMERKKGLKFAILINYIKKKHLSLVAENKLRFENYKLNVKEIIIKRVEKDVTDISGYLCTSLKSIIIDKGNYTNHILFIFETMSLRIGLYDKKYDFSIRSINKRQTIPILLN
jgi:hypothetical protein